jgi:hypothetical protein
VIIGGPKYGAALLDDETDRNNLIIYNNTMAATGTGWAQLRHQARQLEAQVFSTCDPDKFNTDKLLDRITISQLLSICFTFDHTGETYGR